MTDETVHPLKSQNVSLSAQAQQYLLSLIENGTYEPGEQLPSQSELAAQLGISRPTLREALLNLEQDGLIVLKHGVGTFVAPGYAHRLESGLERLESILELAERQGMQLEFRNLEVREEPATPELASGLGVAPDALLTTIRRVIVADGTPVAYMVDIVPATVLAAADIDDSFNGSVLDLMRQKLGVESARAVAEIVAINVNDFLASKLSVPTGQALLLLEELVYADDGSILDFSRNYFVPEYFRFRVLRR
jgi:GntR family transcriptional regulator